MGNRIRKKISKKGGSAQKRMSSQLESKFANMHITHSQSVPDVAQLKKNHDIRHNFYKELGLEPQLPKHLYKGLQEAIEAIQHFEENENDIVARMNLKACERHVNMLADYFDDELPKGWKYERANALALLV